MPNVRISFHPAAVAEVDAAVQWYAERSPVAARAFAAEVNACVERVREAPEEVIPNARFTAREADATRAVLGLTAGQMAEKKFAVWLRDSSVCTAIFSAAAALPQAAAHQAARQALLASRTVNMGMIMLF